MDVYFSMPLGAKFKEKNVWLPVLERTRERLALWKGNYLTKK